VDLLARLRAVKLENKRRLAQLIAQQNGIIVDPAALFDVQVKRLHEYKRQVLNALHIIHTYLTIKDNPGQVYQPRVFIFAAKAAPGYTMAKLIIKFINDLAGVIDRDPDVQNLMKVIFLSDYRVSLAERIIPASDLSEQISTAGTEASGTGNMKFALNGALTIGTLDGANVEIRDAVGADNFFLFGLNINEVASLRAGGYNPWDYYHSDAELRRVLDLIRSPFFNLEQPDLFKPIWDALLTHGDHYLHLADFRSYVECQTRVDDVYCHPEAWSRMCLMNIANMGPFSSDRTIEQYASEIWKLEKVPIALPPGGM
jgi:starch phosphorylase